MVAAAARVVAGAFDAAGELEAVADPEREVQGLDCPGPVD